MDMKQRILCWKQNVMSLPASSSAYRSCDPRLYDVLWRESELASQVGLCQRHMQWRIWVPQRMPCLKHRRAHNNPYYNMSFYKKSRLLSNTSVFDYHILDPNSKSISFAPTYLYHNQPYKNMFFFCKKEDPPLENLHKHTLSQSTRQAIGARALLLGSTAALQQLKAKDVQSHEMPMEEEVRSWNVVVSSLLFSVIFFWMGECSPMVSGSVRVGWETDSRCRVKLGKGGIYEQNNLVFLKGNMQWQTTHRFWCCWCQRLLKGSPAVAAIWVMVYGSLPTKNWSNVVTLALMVAESCLVYGVEFMGKTDQAGWWRGLCGWFIKKLQKYDNKRCCVSDLHLINNGAVLVGG